MLLGPDGEQLVPGHPHIWGEGAQSYLGFDFRKGGLAAADKMGIRELHWVDDQSLPASARGWPTVWTPLRVSFSSSASPSLVGQPLVVRLRNTGSAQSTVAFDLVRLTSPAPPAPLCWQASGDHWCGSSHPGQQAYDADSGKAIAASLGGTVTWEKVSPGWRFCGVTLDQCKDACIQLGDCAEVNMASNECCYPAQTACEGSQRPNDDKYLAVGCSASAAPPSAPGVLPSRGIKVLSGKASDATALACVTDPGQTTVGSGVTIAAQCCEPSGTCRRYIGTNDNDGCVAGHSKQVSPKGAIQATTYSEAHAMCSDLGLQLCDKSCAGAGCAYNRHPVWTRLECDADSNIAALARASALSSKSVQAQEELALASYSYEDTGEAGSGFGGEGGAAEEAADPPADSHVLLGAAIAVVAPLVAVAILAAAFFFRRRALARDRCRANGGAVAITKAAVPAVPAADRASTASSNIGVALAV